MKIKAIKSQENKSDILELNGNIFKINGKDYDLDNLLLPEVGTDENPKPDNTQFFIDNQCYIENGITQLKIYVDNQHFFLFVNNNYLLFHDKDLNGEIDLTELADLITCYNLSEEDRRKEHLEYKATFTDEEWVARRKSCGQLK